jgi:DNA-binding XRE family transcriptional regulator
MYKIKPKTDKIAELRIKNGYSVAALANAVGVSRQAIDQIEKKQICPKAHTAKVICDIFKVQFEELFEIKKEGE